MSSKKVSYFSNAGDDTPSIRSYVAAGAASAAAAAVASPADAAAFSRRGDGDAAPPVRAPEEDAGGRGRRAVDDIGLPPRMSQKASAGPCVCSWSNNSRERTREGTMAIGNHWSIDFVFWVIVMYRGLLFSS